MEQIKKIEERLAMLEERDKSREREVMDLKKEIFDLQKENFSIQKELYSVRSDRSAFSLVDRVSQLENEMEMLQAKVREQEQIHEKQENAIQTSQFKIDQTLTLENSLNELTTWKREKTEADEKMSMEINDFVNENRAVLEDTNKKIEDVKNRHQEKSARDKTVQDSRDKQINVILTKLDETGSEMGKVRIWQEDKDEIDKTFREKYEERMTTLNGKCDGNNETIKTIQERQKLANAMFLAVVKTKQELVVGERKRLNECVNVLYDEGWFDRESCCLIPQQDCRMALAWRVGQFEEGVLMARMRCDEDNGGDYLGMTSRNNDACNGVTVMALKKGEKVWMEVQRLKELSNATFGAVVKTKQELVVGEKKRLNECVNVLYGEGWFDRESCCLIPQQDCRMALAWRVLQFREGELMAFMRWDGDNEGDYLGMTTQKNDVCNGVMVREVKKGEKVWMEVERLKGQARAGWCYFMGWVIGE